MTHKNIHIASLIILSMLAACKKDWLALKTDTALVVPDKLENYQALLDYEAVINDVNAGALGEIGTTDYFIETETWKFLSLATERNAYIWLPNTFEGEAVSEWDNPYQKIYYANVALEGVAALEVPPAYAKDRDNIRGCALFIRAFNTFQLASLFCNTYDPATASSDHGIPLKLTSSPDEKTVRGTVEDTYRQIIKDLLEAEKLLPVQAAYKTRPSRSAALALLARTYLVMSNYDKALTYADEAIRIYPNLLDYNTAIASSRSSFKEFNEEVLYHAKMLSYTILSFRAGGTFITPDLFAKYTTNDLRRTKFFAPGTLGQLFVGSYSGSATPIALFSGIANDEVYLTRAECYARKNKPAEAMNDLNTLLQSRWKAGTFIPFTAGDAEAALRIILEERKKELIFRGITWMDLRRLNKDDRFKVTLTRELDGKQYTLPPNDPRYTYPIPDNEIKLSGIPQNPR